MPLTNTQLRYYDSAVLRLPADKRTEYHTQVDRLIGELSRSIRNSTEIKITKVVKAGSFAKFTILRKTSEDPVDVDLVFYVAGRTINEDTLETLNDTIHDLLIKIYPSKAVDDFEIQRKAATVSFVGSGLRTVIDTTLPTGVTPQARDSGARARERGNVVSVTVLSVDIVPVIEDETDPGYGWQFDLKDGSSMRTCAPCQIQFVRDRKGGSPETGMGGLRAICGGTG